MPPRSLWPRFRVPVKPRCPCEGAMPKPILSMSADWHLQNRAWTLAAGRDISGDSYYSLKQIVDHAIEHEVQAVVGAGDLIDKTINNSDPIVFLNQQLDRLQKKEIRCLYVQGQHEMQDRPWLSGHAWPEHMSGLQVTIDTVCMFGLDFHHSPQLQIALNAIPEGTHLLVAHQVWGEFMGSVAAPQGGMSDVPMVGTVFTGDYHVRKEIETRGKDGQKLRVISPGSTCMQSIDEPWKKFFYVVYDDYTWKKVRLKTRHRVDWHVSAAADVDNLLQTVDTELTRIADETAGYDERVRKPIYWVEYPHKLGEHRGRIVKAIGDRAFIFWKEVPPEPPPEVVARRKEAQAKGERRAATLLTELPGYLQQAELGHLQGDCTRLLQAGSVEDELRRMREEALK